MFFLEQMGKLKLKYTSTLTDLLQFLLRFLSLLLFSLSFGKKVNKSVDITFEAYTDSNYI